MITDEKEILRLGRLYPVVLSDYNPEWPKIYSCEKSRIENAIVNENIERISHIGSTSIKGMTAKPTIDILLEIRDNTDTENIISKLTGIGYIYDPQPQNPPPHMMFMKGYGKDGFSGQTFHIHIRYKGDWDEFYFRDYLAMHPGAAEKYIILKQHLKEKHEFNREAYTAGKTEYIREILKTAR